MADISLTASMRTNLLSLQNTQSLMDTTQERLSTGLKVNSAIDNASSYYTAQSLNNRASDLSALLDSMGQGIQTIQAANEGIEAITEFVEQAKAIANSARDAASKTDVKTLNAKFSDLTTPQTPKTSAGDGEFAGQGDKAADTGLAGNTATSTVNVNTDRQKYAEQFNEIMRQIDKLAKDSGYKGINLLQMNTLTVIFNEDRSSQIEVKGVDASSTGLKISNPVNSWQTNENIETSIRQTEEAISSLRIMASDYGNYYSIVQNRQSFTKSLVNVLTEGADNLTLADMNEESANMLALQTRQQLAINSLSLASQAAQGVLQLF